MKIAYLSLKQTELLKVKDQELASLRENSITLADQWINSSDANIDSNSQRLFSMVDNLIQHSINGNCDRLDASQDSSLVN